MTNFIFKSPRRLIKNVDNTQNLNILGQLKIIQSQNRFLRSDIHEMSLKLERLLIDKHLQMQVDEYFTQDEEPEDKQTEGE